MTSQTLTASGFHSRPASPALGRVLATDEAVAPVLLRLTVAAVLFPHGAQKALGWFGGGGYAATLEAFQGAFGIGPALATLAIGVEFLAPVALALGLLVRPAALGLIGLMTVAASFHLQHGFFLNWYGNQAGQGIEFHLLMVGALLALLATGAGRWSFDRALTGR